MKTIFKCSICGYIYKDEKAPKECPFCHNPAEVFFDVNPKMVDYEFIYDAWQKQVNWMNNTKYQDEIKLTDDEGVLKSLAEAEIKNLLKKGQAYCPCRVLSGNKEADRKIICPCYYYMGEIEIMGLCHCSLFLNNNKLTKKK